jgi:hypothetical protein
MRDDNDEFILELIPAYTLNTLDNQETELVANHLALCPVCREELAAYEAVVHLRPLAVAEAEPSPELRTRLQQRIRTYLEGNDSAASLLVHFDPGQNIWGHLSDLITCPFQRPVCQAAILLLVVALAAGNLILWQRGERVGLQRVPWQRVVLTSTGAVPAATDIIVISGDGEYGTLIVDDLPRLSDQQQYQLWLIKEGERTNGGIFSVSEDGYRSIEIVAHSRFPTLTFLASRLNLPAEARVLLGEKSQGAIFSPLANPKVPARPANVL